MKHRLRPITTVEAELKLFDVCGKVLRADARVSPLIEHFRCRQKFSVALRETASQRRS